MSGGGGPRAEADGAGRESITDQRDSGRGRETQSPDWNKRA